ncbi:MAG: RNA polymerase sigma factor [Bacteroidota bacterium]
MKKEIRDSEVELIQKCLQGDNKAQFALYHRYAKAMLNVAYRILQDEEAAKDVLQMAFLKAFHQLDRLRQPKGFGGWLKRIVVNTAIKQLKKKGLQWIPLSEELMDDQLTAFSEEKPFPIDLAQAKAALKTLPTGYRTILSLYLIEGYDHEEIASILGISVSTSLSQYARGKQKWRAIIKKMNTDGSY